MEILCLISIFLFGIVFLVKILAKYSNYTILFNEKNVMRFLLIWIIFGFLGRLDFSEAFGCLSGSAPILASKNVIFSAISAGLILLAFYTSNQKLKKVLYLSELIYWLLKLMLFKGGYMVGYGGIPDISVVFYDSVSILLRLFLISQIFDNLRLNFYKLAAIGFAIIAIKILIFA